MHIFYGTEKRRPSPFPLSGLALPLFTNGKSALVGAYLL